MCILATELRSSKVWFKIVTCFVFYVLRFSAFVLKLIRNENLETTTCKRTRSVMRLDISKLIFTELAELIPFRTECIFCFILIHLFTLIFL